MSNISLYKMLRALYVIKDINNRILISSLRCLHNFPLCFQSTPLLPERKINHQVIFDLKNTEKIWRKYKNEEIFQKFLIECFEKHENSLTYATDLIFLASERIPSPSELIHSIVVAFFTYIQRSGVPFSPSLIEKADALNAVINLKNYHLIQLVCKVFKINESAQCFKDFINKLFQEQKVIEAAYCIRALNLQLEFPVEKVLFPLLFKEKFHIITTYLANNTDLQLETAKKLDNLLDVTQPNARNEDYQISSRRVFKILQTFINVFKISPEYCPNLHFIRSKSAISILINKRAQQSISETTWKEMMMNVVRENEELKKYLIRKLLLKNEQKTALEMSAKLNISEDTFKAVACDIETQKNLEVVQEEENELLEVTDSNIANSDVTEDVPDTLTFDLNISDIKFVSSKDEFIKCINDLSQNYEMIGIDSEWKPNFGLSHDRLSLIQLAVCDKVYILDILSLSERLDAEQWDKFMDDIFANPKIIKLGCSIMCDIKMIINNNKCTPGKTKRFSHILDISIFYRKLQEVYPEEMNYSNDDDKHFTIGLSKLCEIILGKPLNKEERLCDWEKRPLTDSQLEYAALDAYCLLKMYDKLKKFALKKNMNFDHLSTVAIVMTTSLWKPKKKIKGNRSGGSLNIQTPLPVEKFKVAMDSDLEILGKKLERYGADVLMLNKSDAPEDIAAVAESEGRIIICSEKIGKMVKDKVKDGFCYTVSKNPGEFSVVSDVIQYFNIQLNRKIFSRCFICSSEDCIKLQPDDLNLLRKLVLDKESNVKICDLSVLKSELQPVVNRLFSSKTVLKFNNYSNTGSHKMQTFLCTKCGNIF